MIDGSEKHNRQLAFEFQNSHVCEKCSKELFSAVSMNNWSLSKLENKICRAVSPSHLQKLRIDGEGMINDVIMQTTHDVICKKKVRKR